MSTVNSQDLITAPRASQSTPRHAFEEVPALDGANVVTLESEANLQPVQVQNENGVGLDPVYGIVYAPVPETLRIGPRYLSVRRAKPAKDAGRSIEYPVPSAIRNAIMAKYRDTDEIGEFTSMRCKSSSPQALSSSLITD